MIKTQIFPLGEPFVVKMLESGGSKIHHKTFGNMIHPNSECIPNIQYFILLLWVRYLQEQVTLIKNRISVTIIRSIATIVIVYSTTYFVLLCFLFFALSIAKVFQPFSIIFTIVRSTAIISRMTLRYWNIMNLIQLKSLFFTV